MTAVFADTFYWIAVTTPDDSAYARALEFSRSRPPDQIVTTDEVLSEYLTFFSGMTPSVRLQTGDNAVAFLRNPRVKVMPQSRNRSLQGLNSQGSSRQGLQPDGLHFDDHDAPRGPDRGADQRPAFRAGRFPRPVPGRLTRTGKTSG